jgi:hypothetical protein
MCLPISLNGLGLGLTSPREALAGVDHEGEMACAATAPRTNRLALVLSPSLMTNGIASSVL